MLASMRLDASDVLRWTEAGEGARVEFKRALPRDERAARTLCAFANTRGGLLLVGVTDRGRVHGVHRPAEVTERLVMLAEIHLAPAVPVETQVIEIEGPRVVACAVSLSSARPHAVLLPGGEREIVVRVGASNRVADGPTLDALRRGARARDAGSALEREVVAWVRRQAGGRARPTGIATVLAFAHAFNVGEDRARRAFVRLESRGLLVAHGTGRQRVYTTP